MVNREEIDGLVTCYKIGINCFNHNISKSIEKTIFHVDNDFSISILLCASNMRNFLVSRIALNLTVHRNEYNSTNKIMRQQLAFRNQFKTTFFYCALKNCFGSPLVCVCKWKELSTTTSFTCM